METVEELSEGIEFGDACREIVALREAALRVVAYWRDGPTVYSLEEMECIIDSLDYAIEGTYI